VASVVAVVAVVAVSSETGMARMARMISLWSILSLLLCIRMGGTVLRMNVGTGIRSGTIMVVMIPRACSMILAVVMRMRIAH
jgi:hypothetical protein